MRLSAANSRSVKRIGIIGAGAAAALHLTALRKIDGVRVVAIRDINADKAAAMAVSFGLPPHIADPGQFYEAEPQSIHIATPPYAHEELAREALDHGAHVLVEKPPSLTLAGCESLLRLARARSLAVGVNENTALDPLIRRGRTAIEAGSLGRLLHIDGFYALGMRDGEQPPRWVEGLPGGVLEDLLPHLLTTARALTGVRLTHEYWRLASTGAIAGQPFDDLEAGTEIPAPLERAIETVATLRAIWPLPRQEEQRNLARDAIALSSSASTPCSRTA